MFVQKVFDGQDDRLALWYASSMAILAATPSCASCVSASSLSL
ncbi:hypothetical protein [Moraxella catarrhalis]|nr:hypothetical protein [Moraxella catarrhalis]